MKITLDEIKQAFDSIINDTKSREEVTSWATKLTFAHDDDDLEFDPPSEKDKILSGIVYLTYVATPDTEHGRYSFSIDNFVDWKNEIFNGT